VLIINPVASMPKLTPLPGIQENLVARMHQKVLDPKTHEGFTVRVGRVSSVKGVLGGVLDQKDYDKFMDIVKDINVKDASKTELSRVHRALISAKLLTYGQVGSISSSGENDASGRGINYDAKYNQWDYQQRQLPLYAKSSTTNAARESALNEFKLVAAIANASPITGVTVAKETYSPQDRSSMVVGNETKLSISEQARRLLVRGPEEEKPEPLTEDDVERLIEMLEDMAEQLRERMAAELAAAKEEAAALDLAAQQDISSPA